MELRDHLPGLSVYFKDHLSTFLCTKNIKKRVGEHSPVGVESFIYRDALPPPTACRWRVLNLLELMREKHGSLAQWPRGGNSSTQRGQVVLRKSHSNLKAIELRGVYSDPVLLQLWYAQESPGNLVKMQIRRSGVGPEVQNF